MLRVALADLRGGAIETDGEIPADDPLLASDDAVLIAPLRVSGRLSSAGENQYYWRVAFATTLRAECRRCLEPVDVPLSESAAIVFAAAGEASEEEGFILIPARAQELDLREVLREEFLLALPHFVECRPDCKGLCPNCGANLNLGPCGCSAPASDPRWDALRGLTRPDSQSD